MIMLNIILILLVPFFTIMHQFSLWFIILIGLIIYSIFYLKLVEVASIISKPYDFNFTNNSLVYSNAELIAEDITFYNETEIKDYPLEYLSSEEIKAVFMILDSGNLSKVLLNIDDNNIKNIYDKLTPMTFDKIIQKIPESDRTKIKSKLK